MDFIAIFMAVFSVLGAADLIFGNRLGLGKEFEKGFQLLGNLALSMIGMIVLSPLIGELLSPIFDLFYHCLHIDPSVIPAMLFANDMGGASLASTIGKNEGLSLFNGLVLSSMMGCTISFTIPIALGIVKQKQQRSLLLGFLCGIVTIPIGCFVAGLLCRLTVGVLILNLIPMMLFSEVIACGIVLFPTQSVKVFGIFGQLIKILITIGLAIGIIQFLTGASLSPKLGTIEEGIAICLNVSVVMSGTFPFLYLVSKFFSRPIKWLGNKLKINEISALGLFSSLATSITTFQKMEEMDEKGVVLNAAFAISGAYVFAGHLAFTMAYDHTYVFPVIIGKLVSGISAFCLASVIYRRTQKSL